MSNMRTAARYEPLAPRTEQYTEWHNPLDQEMHVDVFYGGNGHYNEHRPTRLTFPPQGNVEVPSRFDSAIQRVQCSDEACRHRSPWCSDPSHQGVVVGGGAPMLTRVGSNYRTLPSLDPSYAQLEEAKAQLAASDIARRSAENAQLLAEQRRLELEAKLEEATRPDPKPQPARETASPDLAKSHGPPNTRSTSSPPSGQHHEVMPDPKSKK